MPICVQNHSIRIKKQFFLTFFRKISKSRAGGPLLAHLTPFGIFFKKVFLPKWSPYIALTSDRKSEKSLEQFLKKKSKTFLTPFSPKKGQGDFFFKTRFLSLFYIYHPLVSRKSEKSLVNSSYFVLQTRRTYRGKFIAPIPFRGAKKTKSHF